VEATPGVTEIGSPRSEPPKTARSVIEVVRSIAEELHPRGDWFDDLSAKSSLESDAGLDSLSRMELLTRLESMFARDLPEDAVLGAESIADLIRIIGPVAVCEGPEPRDSVPVAVGDAADIGRRGELPVAVEHPPQTVSDLLRDLATETPDRVVIQLLTDGESAEEITAGGLYRAAISLAGVLSRSIEPGRPVAVMLPTGRDFLESFFAVLFAGGVPVPLAPPARLSQIEDHLRRQVIILKSCQAPLLITSPEIERLSRLAKLHLPTLERIATVETLRLEVRDEDTADCPVHVSPTGLALLQYTSGSTGDPKGVMLTHANLLANVAAIAERLETSSDDVYVSWLPLYHDMGLIGGVLHALYCRIPLVLLPPQQFLARPVRWFKAIHRFGGTMTVAPNFAYEICRRRLTDADLEGVDLSGLRLTLNGAEAVSAATLEGFTRRFEPYGYRADAMAACYGLAENTLAVSCARMGRRPTIDTIDRELMLREERAVPVIGRQNALRFVACGPLMRGVEVRIQDRSGHEVGEREIGRIFFRGTSAAAGYYRNAVATGELFDRGWRDSGDLGYRAGEDIFVTGRAKDLVIRAGLNISPAVLEEAVGAIEGIRRGCVAVFGIRDRQLGSERLIVAAETKERGQDEGDRLRSVINEASIACVGIAPDEVALLAPRSLLKTSSGKLRRVACRELFERHQLGSSSRLGVWRQLLRVWLTGVGAWSHRAARRLGGLVFSGYAWTLAGLFLAAIWFGVLLLPRPGWRHGWARRICRLFFECVGSFSVDGMEHLPQEGPFVVASNHASYVDSMVLFAALPRNLAFAAKREFEDHAVTRVLMRRLGTVFVDRAEVGQVTVALDQLRHQAETRGLAVFVEGTFVSDPGLRPFRLGAFQVAVEAGCPVVPLVVSGSRKLLRDKQWLFRPSAIAVRALPPVSSRAEGFSAAVRLRDEVRSQMLETLTEPDLAVAPLVGEEPIAEAERWSKAERVATGGLS